MIFRRCIICFYRTPKLIGSFALCGFVMFQSAYAEQRFSSGINQVSLIELYTSEGCSSCPPADRWLSKLKNHNELWSKFIPVSFHVDYWDYIGWKDPYASRANSQRQRRYATEFGETTVYTPGLRYNGEEWRGWRRGIERKLGQTGQVGEFTFTIDDGQRFSARFLPTGSISTELDHLQLSVALLGMGLVQQVQSGENRGRELTHDFVMLNMTTVAGAESGSWSGELPVSDVNAERYAVVAWVTHGNSLKPIQVTGGLIDR